MAAPDVAEGWGRITRHSYAVAAQNSLPPASYASATICPERIIDPQTRRPLAQKHKDQKARPMPRRIDRAFGHA